MLLLGLGMLALWAVLAAVAPEVTGLAGRQLQAQREQDRLTFEKLLGDIAQLLAPRPGGTAPADPRAGKN